MLTAKERRKIELEYKAHLRAKREAERKQMAIDLQVAAARARAHKMWAKVRASKEWQEKKAIKAAKLEEQRIARNAYYRHWYSKKRQEERNEHNRRRRERYQSGLA